MVSGTDSTHPRSPRSIRLAIEGFVSAPRSEVFEAAAADVTNLSRYFKGNPPLIPGVREASIEGDGELRTGAIRRVVLTDGTSIKERVLDADAPRMHRYDMAEMNRVQRIICDNMVSEWQFFDDARGTRIHWTYEILPRNVWVLPITHLVAKSFRTAMKRCLESIAVDFADRAKEAHK
jgi:hypothetical protein